MSSPRIRKAILLAGGVGKRLYPLTHAVCKQLVPIYDKPLIYYPLSVLMLAGIRDVLIVSTPQDRAAFERLLGTGKQWGMSITLAVQPRPEGIAQALLIGESFLSGQGCALVLGDNIFYGGGLRDHLRQATQQLEGATIFGYHTTDASAYGVVEFDEGDRVIGLEEKPERPKSNYAVTGLYFYDDRAVELAKTLTPSARGELEITDLNRLYLQQQRLQLVKFGRGIAWLDTGTPDAMLRAANFIQTIQARQGLQIACPEEIAFQSGWIDSEQVARIARSLASTAYGRYLERLSRGE